MRGRTPSPHLKAPLAVLLAIVIATTGFGVAIFAPRPAYAIPVEPTTSGPAEIVTGVETKIGTGIAAQDLAQNTTQTSLAVKEEAKATWKVALQNTAAIALLNGLNYFAQKIAYDAAVYVASGGKGQGPLIFDSPGAYFKSVGADAAGEVLGSLTQNSDFLKKYGINLCSPTNPRIALNLKLGFLKSLPGMGVKTNVPTPKCSWDSISNNWDTFTSQDSATVLDNVGVMFSPGESSLAAAIEVNNAALKEINLRKYTSGIEYAVGSGFKAVTDKVSGSVKTPASTVKKTFEYSVESGFQVKDDTKAVTIGAVGSGALAVLTPALKTFAGTLTEQLMKKVFERGLISVTDFLGLDGGDTNLSFQGAAPLGGRANAELANASLLTPKIITLANYNEITDFAACPTEGRTSNNCVVDQQFFAAVSRADQGAPVTLRQAIQQGFLSRGWQLLPLAHPKNISSSCYGEAFCYSNLVKLRKARIIPVGWELAANSPFNDITRPVTLGEAMDRFDDCPMTRDVQGNDIIDETRLPDPLHPWCHMVDPEWVLKYPTSVCRQQGPGPTLLSPQAAARVPACADVATCVAEDASGNCVGGYGYCVREKSAWRLDADACPAQAASCATFNRVDGASFSFLANTLDGAACNSENAGCRRYSLSPNAVPNPSFEDIIDLGPRDWTLSPSTNFHRGGRLSLRGTNSVGLSAGATAQADVFGLLDSSTYRLSAAVLQEDEGTSGLGTVRVEFRDAAGAPVSVAGVEATCRKVTGNTAIALDVVSSGLGYLSGGCDFTTPTDAASAVITLSSNAAASNATWFDDIGIFGSSFSASPNDAIFMNAKVEKCAADGAGCTDFVRLSTGNRNLIRNGSFEDALQDLPLHWTGVTEPGYENGTFFGFDGQSSYALAAAPISQRIEGLMADATHAFSIYSKLEQPGSTTGRATIQLYDASDPPLPVAPATVEGCALVGTAMRVDLLTGSDFALSECRFTTSSSVGSAVVTLTASSASPRLLVDGVQMELSVRPTQFHEGYTASSEHVFLKKAPEGLDCSGQNPPATCARYAPSCRRDEVGCNSYAPVDGGSVVPAVTTDADLCPAECAGYDTFRQEPTDFSDARFPLFLIPSTAGSCTAAEEGCSEFTNIEQLSAGGESRAYFSYLRACAEPGPRSGTFYTWEGNDVRGFQLRTWALMRSNIASSPATDSDPSGGEAPCTKLAYDVGGQAVCADDAASVAAASCIKASVGVNPDCREFYDEAGNVHYRLYAKTVVSNDDCKEYRITKTTEPECRSHGGFWRNGECRYKTYAPESVSCRAEAAGCRAYSGNASRNVRIAFADAFETGTTDGWSAAPGGGATTDVVNSNEAVSAGGHSLKVARADVTKDVATTIKRGRQYLLTFWAKGTGDLSARLSQAADDSFVFDRVSGVEKPVTLTTEWRSYQIGPVEALRAPSTGSAAANEQIAFRRIGGGSPLFYLDNVELREVTGSIYLIEDSWETPSSCDSTPTGGPAPQYMLGCRTYRDREGELANFRSFEKLCRQEAVGCEALYDTRNSASPHAQTFNAVCTTASVCTSITCPCAIGGAQVCQVSAGSTTCRYDADAAVPATNISPTGDTVRVPADAITYLVNDRRYRCESAAIGCVEAGSRTLKPERTSVESWKSAYVKNLPASYASTLCRESEEFCQAYTRRADGAQVYFKDPDTRTCEYREATTLASNGVNASGWYRKDSDTPCDEEYLEAGTRFGIWKNSDPRYDAWAGVCEARYDMCKEFIDPEDRSEVYQGGKPYYAIANDRLDVNTCGGRVSLRQSPASANDAASCILFWQTDNLVKSYDAYATYQASEAANGALVAPLDTATNTANIIIKVKRDRQCGEWLDCRSSETVFNPSTGGYQNVCTAFSLCAEYERVGNSTRCIRYADSSYSGSTLTAKHYAGRDVGWQGMEYSGYAVPNRYPVEELVTVNVGSSSSKPDLRLVRSIGPCSQGYGASCGPASDKGTCLGPSGERQCVYPIDGGRLVTNETQLRQAQSVGGYPGASCRAYPQESAPFPSSIADPNGWNNEASELNNGNPTLIGPSPAFANANVCQRRLVNGVEVSTCECNYFVARYGSQTKYFPSASEDIPQGYCSGGLFENYECDPLATGARGKNNLSCCTRTPSSDGASAGFFQTGCDDGSQCVRLNKIDRVVGYEGQCIERDFTTPINGRSDEYACLTWRPVGLIGGSRDIYNQHQTAGYFAPADRRFYCAGQHPGWTLQFDIPALNKDTSNNEDNFGDGVTTTGGLSSFDANGDGVLDPRDLDIMKFFGPGTINGTTGQSGWLLDCEGVGDESNSGGWCIWPGISTASNKPKTSDGESVRCTSTTSDCGGGFHCAISPDDVEGTCVENKTDWSLQHQALGILGCYELADEGNVNEQYIDWPYVGPPIYKQQLESVYFQITDDIYDIKNPLQPGEVKIRGTETVSCPGDARCAPCPSGCSNHQESVYSYADVITNPHQNVIGDCNNESDDNIDNEDNDSIDSSFVRESDVVSVPDHGRAKSVFHLNEINSWKVDASDGEGVILLSAMFDSNGLLRSVKLAASDSGDEGAFGINRVGFQFKPGCEKIAQIDRPGEFGATVAFTDSVNAFRDFQEANMRDAFNDPRAYADACRPYGAIGAIASAPTAAVVTSDDMTRAPWTYVAGRRATDIEQCTTLDFMKGATYWPESPEQLQAFGTDTNDPRSRFSPLELWSQSLRRLFRSVFAVWDYVRLRTDATQGGYDFVVDDEYDESGNVDGTALFMRGRNVFGATGWMPPRIASVDLNRCDAAGLCKPGRLRAMTINGKEEGLVLGADGALNVTSKFFAWASHDSMPILSRTILWGDFSPKEPSAKGWYKNQKPLCSPDISEENAVGECHNMRGLTCSTSEDCPDKVDCDTIGNHFGNTPGACAAAPYQFDHTYTCSLKDMQAMEECAGAADAADNAPCVRVVSGAPTCVYRPKVQIVDNWGWCNCTGSDCPESFGAWSSVDKTTDGCNLEEFDPNARPWTEFDGEIRLSPTYMDGLEYMASGGPGGPGGAGGGGGGSGGVAVNDNFVTSAGHYYPTSSSQTLLFNDTTSGPAATRQVVVVDSPTHGILGGICDPRGCFTLTPEGGLNYIANSGFHGTDTFSYKIIQGGNSSNVALVTITVP